MTMRTRLTAAFVLVVLVPLLVVVALVTTALPTAVTERQERGVTSSARLAASVLAELCERARAGAQAAAYAAAATSDTTPEAGDAALRARLEELVRRGLADGVRVTAEGGTDVAVGTAPPVPAQDCTTGASPADEADADEEVSVTAVLRLERPPADGGAAAGEVVAAFTVDDALAASLRDAAGAGEVVLLADGRPVAATGAVPGSLLRAALDTPGRPVHGDGALAVLSPARPGQPLAVLVSQPEGEGVSVLPVALAVAALALLLAVAIGTLLARATTRPLGELGDAAARVAAGDLDTTIEVRSRDEVARLAIAFNAMTEELRSYVGALEASRDQLRAGVARIGDTLSATHDLDRILAVVLETAMASTRARAGAVLLPTEDRSALELVAAQGLVERGVGAGLRLPSGSGIVGRVATSGTAVRGRVPELAPAPAEPPADTVLAVPLTSASRGTGVLVVYDREDGGGFDEADLATLRAFTGQATVAVDNVLLHEEARRLSITDGLTGLWNYRYFTMTIGKEIERASRFGRPLALLMLDLDHFKQVNDVHGHQRGDAVLVELAARVRDQVRDVDTVARYGGEEIVAILPETDEDGAAHAAERIRAAVRDRPFGAAGQTPLQVTLSMGVAVFPVHATSATELLRRADQALYAAKGAGRDTWRLAAPSAVLPQE
jgi:two-component system cell cycle response regulator